MSEDRRNEREGTIVRRKALVEGVSRPVVTPIQPSVVYASPSIDMLHAQYEGRETGLYLRAGGASQCDASGAEDRPTRGSGGRHRHGLGHGGGHRGADGDSEGGRSRSGGEPALRPVAEADEPGPRALRDRNEPCRSDGCRGDARGHPARDADDPGRGGVEPHRSGVADMHGIAALARGGWRSTGGRQHLQPRRGAWRPFDHGADIVIHSITKLLAGHSDVTLGYVAAKDPGGCARDLRFRP